MTHIAGALRTNVEARRESRGLLRWRRHRLHVSIQIKNKEDGRVLHTYTLSTGWGTREQAYRAALRWPVNATVRPQVREAVLACR